MKATDKILVSAKKVANYMTANGFIYNIEKSDKSWEKAKVKKSACCSAYASWVLQVAGLLEDGQDFYANSRGNIGYKGSNVDETLAKNFAFIKVPNRPCSNMISELMEGDIVGYISPHVNIFAGINKDGRSVWWDGGTSATKDKKTGSKYSNLHQTKTITSKVCWILRYKYYDKYEGASNKLDEILISIGVSKSMTGKPSARLPIAKKNGIEKYIGTEEQNKELIALAKKGKLLKVW